MRRAAKLGHDQTQSTGPRAPSGGIVDAIVGSLREDILSGALVAGSSLRQDWIANRFEVSHIPVREAFGRLAADGLVTIVPRRGAFVSRMSAEDARELTEMRVALECLAVRRSVPVTTAPALDLASRALTVADTSDRISDWSEMNWQFHRHLYAACGLPRLLATIETLWRQVDRYLRLVLETTDYLGKSQGEHRAILEAYRLGKSSEAERITAIHIEDAGTVLARTFTAWNESS